jgi:DNA-directed RNA polymerase I subunit RPA2
MTGTIAYSIDKGEKQVLTRSLGVLPIMVMSSHCRLRGKTGPQLASQCEEANEFGGYFIVNGIERVIRLLQVHVLHTHRHVVAPTLAAASGPAAELRHGD